MSKEYADRALRDNSKPSPSERRRYRGIAVVPAARSWLLDKWQFLNQRAENDSTMQKRTLARAEANRLYKTMQGLGMLRDGK